MSAERTSLTQVEQVLTQTDIPLFKALSKRHLRRVARTAELVQHVGTVEFVRAGTPGDAFYVIVDGAAEYRALDGETGTLLPGDYFGELALIDGAPRAATVTSIGELTTVRIGRSAFRKLLREEPAIAVGLLPGLVAIVRQLQASAARATDQARLHTTTRRAGRSMHRGLPAADPAPHRSDHAEDDDHHEHPAERGPAAADADEQTRRRRTAPRRCRRRR